MYSEPRFVFYFIIKAPVGAATAMKNGLLTCRMQVQVLPGVNAFFISDLMLFVLVVKVCINPVTVENFEHLMRIRLTTHS